MPSTSNREPTATEALAYIAMRVAEFGCALVIVACIALFWIGAP